MWNRRKLVLAVIAICTGGSILFLEAVLLGADLWSMRLASLREPIDLLSESCDVSQLEEMDAVKGTIRVLYGSYDYDHDSFRDPYVQNTTFYYVLPVQATGMTYYMGIRETQDREDAFRRLAVWTEYDAKPKRDFWGNALDKEAFVTPEQERAEGEPIEVEGFLFRMDETQCGRLLTWLDRTGTDGQVLPYYIEERDLAECRRDCIGGLAWTAAGIVMVAGSMAVLIHWRRRRRRQTHITIGNAVYEKTQLARVNQLVEHIEMMQAVYELRRITGLELPQAEKVVRKWYDYWY